MDPRLILAALVSLGAHPDEDSLPRAAAIERACVEGRVARCAVLHALAFAESGYRLRHRRAPLMGCNPYTRDDVQQARCAARAWNAALRLCRTQARALVRYQLGQCAVPRGRRFRGARSLATRYVAAVLRVAERIERQP